MSKYWTLLKSIFTGQVEVQSAALCWRMGVSGPEVLLITSLTTRRWIIPKGWPMVTKTPAETALTEAYEEAGVKGHVASDPIGHFHYIKIRKRKGHIRCKVDVFAVRVDEMLNEFPEKGERELLWVSLEEASKLVNENALKQILKGFKAEKASPAPLGDKPDPMLPAA